ncbi:hypothetical protein [Halopseudomonas pelagia]|uniref:Uncharacterized protein n=1 Tax=Halopseudomonas pelagia TaxID=553151 RepID=A0AA91U5M7_9GAMM|nr:hypothetical protein [Halopseudomonas pelagia]PCD00965.1 hypothetical protein CO192_02665 [Halopseudomonas pelagia]QFY57605.1 hypothetical protein EAO82_15245 [Halopseudomonas pelagia]
MKKLSWFIPLSEATVDTLVGGAPPDLLSLPKCELAAIHFVLQLSKPLTSPVRSALDMERKFSNIFNISSDQLKAALAEVYDTGGFIKGLVHIPAHRDRPFRLNVTACSGLT